MTVASKGPHEWSLLPQVRKPCRIFLQAALLSRALDLVLLVLDRAVMAALVYRGLRSCLLNCPGLRKRSEICSGRSDGVTRLAAAQPGLLRCLHRLLTYLTALSRFSSAPSSVASCKTSTMRLISESSRTNTSWLSGTCRKSLLGGKV